MIISKALSSDLRDDLSHPPSVLLTVSVCVAAMTHERLRSLCTSDRPSHGCHPEIISGRRSAAFCPQQRCFALKESKQQQQIKDGSSPVDSKPNRMKDSDPSALQIAIAWVSSKNNQRKEKYCALSSEALLRDQSKPTAKTTKR